MPKAPLIVAVFVAMSSARDEAETAAGSDASAPQAQVWTCSMHPLTWSALVLVSRKAHLRSLQRERLW